MEYGDFKPHEADAFELDHMIAYKQSSKFNSRNVFDGSQPRKFSPLKITCITVFIIKFHEHTDITDRVVE